MALEVDSTSRGSWELELVLEAELELGLEFLRRQGRWKVWVQG